MEGLWQRGPGAAAAAIAIAPPPVPDEAMAATSAMKGMITGAREGCGEGGVGQCEAVLVRTGAASFDMQNVLIASDTKRNRVGSCR